MMPIPFQSEYIKEKEVKLKIKMIHIGIMNRMVDPTVVISDIYMYILFNKFSFVNLYL